MTRRLLLTYLTITAFTLVIVVVPLGLTFATRERDRLLFDLERDAQAVASRSEVYLEENRPPDLAEIFRKFKVDGARILVVDRHGRAVADSEPGSLNRDYISRPEVASALAGQRVTGRRRSNTLDLTLAYVAVPVASKGLVRGAVRITLPSSTVDARVRDTWLRLAALSAVVMATVGEVGLVLARGVTRPVRQVEEAARRLAAGDLRARAGVVRGAPELATLARQFDATAERLQQLVEAQHRFVADASHQLRTPLTALRLRLETLAPSADDRPRVAAALAETDRLASLVQSLLVIARSDSAEPVLADVDLVALAYERQEMWSIQAATSRVLVTVEGPDQLVVRAVQGGVEQIIDNLIANAMSVVDADTTISIALASGPDDGGRMTITDQGPGMTADERSRATGRFWRPPGATSSGSGLGLAIVEHLVMAGGGQLALEDGPGGTGLQVVVDFAPPEGRPSGP